MKRYVFFLFALLIIQGNSLWAQCSGTGSISFERWNNVTGTSVQSLATATNNYQNAPSSMGTWTSFNSPVNAGDNYGLRVRGYICAPQTGTYRFWILGDNEANLIVSNSSAVSTNVVASIPVGGFCNAGQWNKYASQKSAAINLVAGQQYYIEAILKEGTGPDRLSVGWAKPGQSTTAPSQIIPGTNLIPMPSTPICGCGNPLTASFTLSNIVQTGTRVSFGLSSCNATNFNIFVRQGTNIVAQVNGTSNLYIDLPANLSSGSYTIQAVGVSCLGTSNQATFQYTAPLPACGCGASSPLSVLSVAPLNSGSNVYDVSFNACNLTNANWRVKDAGNNIVVQGNVSPTSAHLNLNFGTLANGNYTFELEGTTCSGVASLPFTVNNIVACGCGSFALSNIQQNNNRINFSLSTCNLNNATITVYNGSTIVAQTTKNIASIADLYIDVPANTATGNYQLQVVGNNSCVGQTAPLAFNYQTTLATCGCGASSPLSILSVTPSTGTLYNVAFNACNLTNADWKVRNTSNTIVTQGNVSPTSSILSLDFGSLANGTYTLELTGTACSGSATFSFSVNNVPTCGCGSFTLSNIQQSGTRINFGLSSLCNLSNATITVLNGSSVVAQVTKNISSVADLFIDLPVATPAGTYTLQLQGLSCNGSSNSLSFNYQSNLPSCGCGTSALSLVSVTPASGTLYNVVFNACNLTNADWKVRNSSNAIVVQGNVSPTSSTLSLNFGTLNAGNYLFELTGTACSGSSSLAFTVGGGGGSTCSPIGGTQGLPANVINNLVCCGSLDNYLNANLSSYDGNLQALVFQNNKYYYYKNGIYDANSVGSLMSPTKWITATIILKLQEQGLLNVNDRVSQYIPSFSVPDKTNITIKQLFAHTSGLPADSPYESSSSMNLQQAVDGIATLPLLFTPGTAESYGSVAAQVAARIAEVVSGQSFVTLFDQYIKNPLGMSNTNFNNNNNPAAGWGLQSSLNDYAKFLQMMFQNGTYNGNTILSPASIQFMEQDASNGIQNFFGFGVWRYNNGEVIAHGSAQGIRPFLNRQEGYWGIIWTQKDFGTTNNANTQFSTVEVKNNFPACVNTNQTPACACNGTMSITYATVISNQVRFGMNNACNLGNMTIQATLNGNLVAQVSKSLSNPQDMFLDLPANAASGNYVLTVTGISCQGSANTTFSVSATPPPSTGFQRKIAWNVGIGLDGILNNGLFNTAYDNGVRTLCLEIDWGLLEISQDNYNFGELEWMIETLEAKGYSLILYINPWFALPNSISTFNAHRRQGSSWTTTSYPASNTSYFPPSSYDKDRFGNTVGEGFNLNTRASFSYTDAFARQRYLKLLAKVAHHIQTASNPNTGVPYRNTVTAIGIMDGTFNETSFNVNQNPLGDAGYSDVEMSAYGNWLASRYGSIASLNSMWGTSFSSFASIDRGNVPKPSLYSNGYDVGYNDNHATRDLYRFRLQKHRNLYIDFVNTIKNPASVDASLTNSTNLKGMCYVTENFSSGQGITWGVASMKYMYDMFDIYFSSISSGSSAPYSSNLLGDFALRMSLFRGTFGQKEFGQEQDNDPVDTQVGQSRSAKATFAQGANYSVIALQSNPNVWNRNVIGDDGVNRSYSNDLLHTYQMYCQPGQIAVFPNVSQTLSYTDEQTLTNCTNPNSIISNWLSAASPNSDGLTANYVNIDCQSTLMNSNGRMMQIIEDEPLVSSLNLYPNPTQGKLTLQLNSSENTNANLVVRNTLGQIVFQTSVSANQGENIIPLELSTYGKGIYIIGVEVSGKIFSERVVVE